MQCKSRYMSVCLSVCYTLVDCIKTPEQIVKLHSPPGGATNQVFLHQIGDGVYKF